MFTPNADIEQLLSGMETGRIEPTSENIGKFFEILLILRNNYKRELNNAYNKGLVVGD